MKNFENEIVIDNSELIEKIEQPIEIEKTIEAENIEMAEQIIETENTEALPVEKKKRGRKKGGKNKVIETTETPENIENKNEAHSKKASKSDEVKNEIFDKSKYKIESIPVSAEAPKIESQKTQNIDLAKYINGALLLVAIDSFFPALILKIAGYFTDKFKKTKRAELRLTAADKKNLEPLADELIKSMIMEMHPAAAFFLALSVIYTGKLLNLGDND